MLKGRRVRPESVPSTEIDERMFREPSSRPRSPWSGESRLLQKAKGLQASKENDLEPNSSLWVSAFGARLRYRDDRLREPAEADASREAMLMYPRSRKAHQAVKTSGRPTLIWLAQRIVSYGFPLHTGHFRIISLLVSSSVSKIRRWIDWHVSIFFTVHIACP